MNITHSIGLDTAKSSACYHLLDRSGHCVSRGQLKAQTAAVHGLLAHLSCDPDTVLVVAESTGMLHLDYCEAFHKAGCRVAVVNPLYKCNRSPKNAIRDNKTDPLDAEALAGLGLTDSQELLTRFGYRCAADFFKLQRYQSSRQLLRKCLTNITKHIGTLVHTLFPELDALNLGIHQVGTRRLLRAHPSPACIAAEELSELRTYVGDKAEALKRAAANSFAIGAMAAACEEGLLAKLLDSYEQLEQNIQQLDHKIAQLLTTCAGSTNVGLVRSIPGFGEKTTPAVLAFIKPEHLKAGNKRTITRKLQAHFGTDPRVKQSGRWKGTAKISKRGNRIARNALFQAAFCGIKFDPQLRQYYRSLRDRGKDHKLAMVDLMRKQLNRLVSVLVNQQPFTPKKQTI